MSDFNGCAVPMGCSSVLELAQIVDLLPGTGWASDPAVLHVDDTVRSFRVPKGPKYNYVEFRGSTDGGVGATNNDMQLRVNDVVVDEATVDNVGTNPFALMQFGIALKHGDQIQVCSNVRVNPGGTGCRVFGTLTFGYTSIAHALPQF